MRKLIVNATVGRIDEYNDQNALVCSHDLRHLVTYIIPDSSTIDSIYKCVILLFSEPDEPGNAGNSVPDSEQPGKRDSEEKGCESAPNLSEASQNP